MSELNPTASMPNEELIERLKKLNNRLIEKGALRLSVPVQGTDDDMLIAEAVRRLAALPRIYDVSKGERPESDCRVVVRTESSGIVLAGAYHVDEDKILLLVGKYPADELDWIIKADDLAAWISQSKGPTK